MPNTASTITNTQPQMPFHFIPDGDAASHLSRHIRFANQGISKVDTADAHSKALKKLKLQITDPDNFPNFDERTKPQIANFLNPQDQAHSNEEFKALESEYIKLKEPRGDRSITSYVESVQKITQNANKKFDAFLSKEKKAFHDACQIDYPNLGAEKRKKAWEMYETNLKKNIQEPLNQFTKEIDGLVPQALTYYVNRLGLSKKNMPSSTGLDENIKEKLERKLQYTDSKGKPIIITKDKKTGQPSEIRIDPMSSLFGKSGDIGDAYAILAAYHGKDIPIRVVVPVFEDDNIYTEMKDFIALLIFLVFAQIYKHLEKNHYLKDAKQATLAQGISLDNISLVDTQGRPIVFSEKDKAEVKKNLQKSESNFLGYEKMQKEIASKNEKVQEQAQEENSQPQQPSLKPSLV